MKAKRQLEFEFPLSTASFVYLKPQVVTVKRLSTLPGHISRKVTFCRRNLLNKICENTSHDVQVLLKDATNDKVAIQKALEQMHGFQLNAAND